MWSPGSVVGETAVRAVDQLSVEIVFRNIDTDRTVVLLVIRVLPTGIRAGYQDVLPSTANRSSESPWGRSGLPTKRRREMTAAGESQSKRNLFDRAFRMIDQ
jgi:hypothetical protein